MVGIVFPFAGNNWRDLSLTIECLNLQTNRNFIAMFILNGTQEDNEIAIDLIKDTEYGYTTCTPHKTLNARLLGYKLLIDMGCTILTSIDVGDVIYSNTVESLYLHKYDVTMFCIDHVEKYNNSMPSITKYFTSEYNEDILNNEFTSSGAYSVSADYMSKILGLDYIYDLELHYGEDIILNYYIFKDNPKIYKIEKSICSYHDVERNIINSDVEELICTLRHISLFDSNIFNYTWLLKLIYRATLPHTKSFKINENDKEFRMKFLSYWGLTDEPFIRVYNSKTNPYVIPDAMFKYPNLKVLTNNEKIISDCEFYGVPYDICNDDNE